MLQLLITQGKSLENSTYSFPLVIQIMSENKDLYKIQGQGIFVVCQLIPVRMAGHKTTLFPKPEAWESLSDFLNLHFQSVCYFSPLSMSSSLSHKPVATAIITKIHWHLLSVMTQLPMKLSWTFSPTWAEPIIPVWNSHNSLGAMFHYVCLLSWSM